MVECRPIAAWVENLGDTKERIIKRVQRNLGGEECAHYRDCGVGFTEEDMCQNLSIVFLKYTLFAVLLIR